MVCNLSSLGREFHEQAAMFESVLDEVYGEGTRTWDGRTRRPVGHEEGGCRSGLPLILYDSPMKDDDMTPAQKLLTEDVT